MSTAYSVHVEVGAYSWDVEGNDTPNDATPTYGLADPLTITQRWPSSDLAPNVQPEYAEASISIIAASGATYAAMALGDPVAVEFYSQPAQAGGIIRSFYGRVAAMSSAPHDLGIIYTLTCVDYLADLAEITVGVTVDWPAERVTDRLQRILAEAHYPGVPALPPTFGATGDYQSVVARTMAPVSAYDAIVRLLDGWAVTPKVTELGTTLVTGPPAVTRTTRPILVQRITARRQAASPVGLEWVTNGRRVDYNPPGRLATVAGLLSIQMLAANNIGTYATGCWILDAGNVNRAVTYTQAKGSGTLSMMTVTTPTASTTYDSYDIGYRQIPTTNVGATMDTDLGTTPTGFDSTGGFLVNVYLMPNTRPDARPLWTTGTLEWDVWSIGTGWGFPTLGDLVVVSRIDPTRNPANRTWIVGTVASWQLVIQNGRPVVQLELIQQTNSAQDSAFQRGSSNGVATFASPVLGTTTFAQLSTTDSFGDYALVRGTA